MMTPAKPSGSDDRTAAGPAASLGWTRREKEIIFRRLGGRPSREANHDAVPSPPARAAAPARRRRLLLPGQLAALLVFGLALMAFIAGALTSDGRADASAERVAAAPVVLKPPAPSPTAAADDRGEAVVRAFYEALGEGDGETASALVVAEKRSSGAFSPREIARFYGGLREPLRLTTVTPLPGGAYRVGYRYSAGRSACDGAAVVTLASRDGRDLIRSIRALNGC